MNAPLYDRSVPPINPRVLAEIFDNPQCAACYDSGTLCPACTAEWRKSESVRSANGCFGCDTFGKLCADCRASKERAQSMWPVTIAMAVLVCIVGALAVAHG